MYVDIIQTIKQLNNKAFFVCINPNSLDNKGSCWILKDFSYSVTMLRELGLIDKPVGNIYYSKENFYKVSLQSFTYRFHHAKS